MGRQHFNTDIILQGRSVLIKGKVLDPGSDFPAISESRQYNVSKTNVFEVRFRFNINEPVSSEHSRKTHPCLFTTNAGKKNSDRRDTKHGSQFTGITILSSSAHLEPTHVPDDDVFFGTNITARRPHRRAPTRRRKMELQAAKRQRLTGYGKG